MAIPDRYQGLLCIGDPHLASRNPGFRKDEYPTAILGKLRWALEYAGTEKLLPVLLGDLFHWPRDNANWLLTEVLNLFAGREILSVTGNHDTTERNLREDDSLAVIAASGRVRLVDQTGPWSGRIAGRPVVIGGSTWSDKLPDGYTEAGEDALVIWIAHHNIGFPGAGEDWLRPRALPGIDILINGHIHRPMEDVKKGNTHWINPGNISRVQRADAVREARPAVLRLDIQESDWTVTRVEVPFADFEEVFHLELANDMTPVDSSAFVQGLETLRQLKTEGGVGLLEFLDRNLSKFDDDVAEEIRSLAKEVCVDEQQ
ncbi:MAG: metallophosphoesterase family protein [Candidatus Sumerlaeia bacterium]|nr:metallophosphoesterase family protein [Candidatus Sumerlaeia bacterium]